MVEARVGPDTVEIWYDDQKVEELPRLRGRSKPRVDYHIIDWLISKPNAFKNYHDQSDPIPTLRCPARRALSQTWGASVLGARVVGGRGGETLVEGAIRFLIGSQRALNAKDAIRLMEDTANVVFGKLLSRSTPSRSQSSVILWTSDDTAA
jgi:hypothetical protein